MFLDCSQLYIFLHLSRKRAANHSEKTRSHCYERREGVGQRLTTGIPTRATIVGIESSNLTFSLRLCLFACWAWGPGGSFNT